jgi:hypothetical protein
MQVGVDQTSYPLLLRLATWTAQVKGEQVVQEKPKSRLEVHAPQWMLDVTAHAHVYGRADWTQAARELAG